MRERQIDIFRYLYQGLLGAIIGVGAVLPGISGGVLCVAFGIYKPVMELLGNSLRIFKTHKEAHLDGEIRLLSRRR